MNLNKVKLSDYSIIYTPTAKQCVLIAVNLLLDTKSFLISIPLQDYKYWQEVKQEVQKL
jgi:hypothetical protein